MSHEYDYHSISHYDYDGVWVVIVMSEVKIVKLK